MASNENLIPIPGRLHSVATEGHVSGANEIYDDTLQKDQATINAENNTTLEGKVNKEEGKGLSANDYSDAEKAKVSSHESALAAGGSVDTRIAAAVNALDAEASQEAGSDGLSLSVSEVDGKITSISGSIAPNTYDAYGAASTVKSGLLGDASTNYNTLGKIEDAIEGVEELIPLQATSSNQLADKEFVNDSVSTATATFRGTSEAGLTETQFLEWANSLTKDLNDYVFWNTVDTTGNTQYKRYKYDGTQWAFEYTLNNSSFTAAQWAAIESGMTEALKNKLVGLPTGTEISQQINAEAVARASADSDINATIGTDSTSGTVKGRIKVLEDAVGTGGSVDSRIADAKSEIKGSATSACDTLGKAEALIGAEQSRAQSAEAALDSEKADKATTLAGYGITDAYTKSETYTKTEVNGLVDTPHQEYVTVDAYASLPATGSKDTIYRVSNYNGSTSQVDASVYSEYAWNGTQYIFLCVKSQIGEVFDISVYNNNAKYADLATALNGGANIPQSLQKGGMSVKFVQSSDNKYVQYRLMSDTFNTTAANWQGVDEEPTAGSDNLVKSGGVYKSFDCPAFSAETTLGHMIKELYLTGINENLLYDIRDFGMYDNSRQTMVIYQGDTAVAQSDTVLGYDGVAEVWQLSNSGISGYVVYDLSPMSGIVMEYKNYINNKKVQMLTENSLIYTFLKNKELSDNVVPDIESIHSLVDATENNIINITETTIGWYNEDTSYYTVGYNKPFEKDSVIERIELGYNVTGLSVGTSMDVVYGLIDQRGWFIKDGELPCVISAINGNVITLSPSVKKTIKAGRMIVVNCGEKWDIWGTYPPTSITEEYGALIHVNLNNLPTGVTQRTDVALCNFRVYVTEVDSIFATDYDLNVLDEKVSYVSEAVAASKVFIDSATGDRYLLVVTNGNLVLRSLQLNKILVLGNSMTEHGDSPGIWWGNGRGMAASVDATQYTSIISAKTGAVVDKGNYAGFETSYSPNYDFASNMPISNGNSYNLVIVQLFENAAYNDTMQASWEALYDYIRTQCPNAQIVQVIGWYEQQKANAVQAAAVAKGVTILNCNTEISLGEYTLGDYVTGYDGSYHAIENSGVSSHPSDIGMFGIAKRVLDLYMIDADDVMKNITIGGISGGTIEVPYSKWVVGGVVNVRVTSGTINSVAVNNGSVNVTKQDSTHFTFVMPNEDVVITT